MTYLKNIVLGIKCGFLEKRALELTDISLCSEQMDKGLCTMEFAARGWTQ